ncbi:MAG: cell wall hydrolase [Desulfobacterales bacterium]|nr:cell wall hydrolase [Desulfobacterales bacterium]MBF0397727.1 cell wall hydrolase [Desulfobacterales bacterium]
MYIIILLILIIPLESLAEPICLSPNEGKTIEEIIKSHKIQESELLARLAYAEGKSTGFPDDPLVYKGIAWGVMNRVRLSKASINMEKVFGKGISGVIFKKGQFNPAISKRSQFSKDFLCPDNVERFAIVQKIAEEAIIGENNPFIQTAWEKEHNISLVVNFYYPSSIQAKGTLAPWEKNKNLQFIGDINIYDKILSAKKIRFYRLSIPPFK